MRKRTTFVQHATEFEAVTVVKISTELNRADVLTKVLSPKVFAKMRDLILNVRRAAANIHSYVKHQIG